MQAPKELNQTKEQELLEECGAVLIDHGLGRRDLIYNGSLVHIPAGDDPMFYVQKLAKAGAEAEASYHCLMPNI